VGELGPITGQGSRFVYLGARKGLQLFCVSQLRSTRMSSFGLLRAALGSSSIGNPFVILNHSLARL